MSNKDKLPPSDGKRATPSSTGSHVPPSNKVHDRDQKLTGAKLDDKDKPRSNEPKAGRT